MFAQMIAQTDSTGQIVTLIVFGLVSVAALLALLTAWYWRVTDPSRRADVPRGPGGRRRRADVEPDPKPNPDPVSNPVVRQPVVNPVPETGPDSTRVLDRDAILGGETAGEDLPKVIDLRTDADRTAPEVQKRAPEPVDTSIDIDEVDAAEVIRGGHDSGISFDEWLALAEDEA